MAHYKIEALIETDDEDEDNVVYNAEALLDFYDTFDLRNLSVYRVTHLPSYAEQARDGR